MSEANHKIMLEEGCKNVVPVFHSGESLSVLRYMVKQGYPYIGISPNNDWAEKAKVDWLCDVWDGVDLSNTMTHGFGYMGKQGLKSVDLTTADSAAWIFNAAMGFIITPIGNIGVTEQRLGESTHIDSVGEHDLKIIENWISEIGLHTLDELRESHYPRKAFNARSISILTERLTDSVDRDKSRDRCGMLFVDENSTGFGYTEPFSEGAVEQAMRDIRVGKVKQIPLSDRKTSPPRKPKPREQMGDLF